MILHTSKYEIFNKYSLYWSALDLWKIILDELDFLSIPFQIATLRKIKKEIRNLHLIFSIWSLTDVTKQTLICTSFLKNQDWVGQTWFFVYFELDFYCLCSLQKSIADQCQFCYISQWPNTKYLMRIANFFINFSKSCNSKRNPSRLPLFFPNCNSWKKLN